MEDTVGDGQVSVGKQSSSGADDQGGSAPRVTVRYWAGARARAGVDEEIVRAATVGEALAAAVALHEGLAPVAEVSALLVDGHAVTRDHLLSDGDLVEVLPPFAGG